MKQLYRFSITVYWTLVCSQWSTTPVLARLEPIEYRMPLPGEQPLPGTPWPKPQSMMTTERTFTLNSATFQLESNLGPECQVIENGLKRYRDIVFVDPKYRASRKIQELTRVRVEVSQPDCGYPEPDSDEWYSIVTDLEQDEMRIVARTVWGALRGLDTFSQLVYVDQKKRLLINQTNIVDYPRFSYRGLMLDTARHFVPMVTILANLDAMAYNKFNAFHWHLVDDQSFPFVSERFPTIHQKGAYSPRHVYSPQDVQDVIEYARMRGIRVIPELDTPGHTHALARAYPDLLTPCYGKNGKKYEPNFPYNSETEILNPMRNETFRFMKDLFAEFRSVFHDDYIHLGMDEVFYACWKSSPEVARFMAQHGMKQHSDLEQYYVKESIKMLRGLGYKYLIWQDPLEHNIKIDKDSVLMIWKDKKRVSSYDHWENYAARFAKNKNKMVLSACWYLNHITYPNMGQDWERFYGCDPTNFNGSKADKQLMIGGEACMWGEFVDSTNLLSRLWPRASAVAERLWSDAGETQDVDTARHRLDQHRCRMVQRGIPAAPILNGYCGDYEWEMNRKVELADMGDRIRLDRH